MGTRSVRLDDEAEEALEDVTRATGFTMTDAIKRGLLMFRAEVNESRKPSDFFNSYDFGEGGDALGSARDMNSLLKNKLRSRKRKK